MITLTWPTKSNSTIVEFRELLYLEEYQSDKPGINDNLLIHGDNLLGLTALEREYAGKIKCIYIDPPYNTKSCFTHYDDSMEHSMWLDMMRDRLILLHRLLKIDGTIWISIDDDECHYLKVLCDEIFGRKNFISSIVWEKVHTRKNSSKYLSSSHEYLLCYSKEKQLWKRNLLPRNDDEKNYSNPDSDPRGPWKKDPIHARNYYSADYVIRKPNGIIIKKPVGRHWRYSEESIQRFICENRIVWGSRDAYPMIKRFLSEVQEGLVPTTLWRRSDVGDNSESKKEVKQFNQNDHFSTPKPERLIRQILNIATNPGDIVLDCFAGSGTTGAVAHKMGRRWIMIEIGEHAKTHIIPRLKKVIDGEDSGGITQSVNWQGGGGFKFYKN